MKKGFIKLIYYIDKAEQFALILMLPDITSVIIMSKAIYVRKKITNKILSIWN